MSSVMDVILLERIESLGNLGDRVKVKSGYARNYLLPQKKALRATNQNIAYFEVEKKNIEKQNEGKKKDATKQAKGMENLSVTIIRLASESGQLYGSVTSRDIADAINEQGKEKIERTMVEMNQTYKTIGLFPVSIALHPELKIDVTINIARSEEEAKLQAKTGKALLADSNVIEEIAIPTEEKAKDAAEKSKEEMLEGDALDAEKEKAEDDAKKSAEDDAKSKEKSDKRAAKKAEKESVEAEAAEIAEEESSEEKAEEEDAKEEIKAEA